MGKRWTLPGSTGRKVVIGSGSDSGGGDGGSGDCCYGDSGGGDIWGCVGDGDSGGLIHRNVSLFVTMSLRKVNKKLASSSIQTEYR